MSDTTIVEKTVAKTLAEQELIQKVEPVLENIGLELRDLSIVGSGSSATVRITLDRPLLPAESAPGEPTGKEIGIDECTSAHHVLGPMFDVWDPLPGAYTLEVSSPGEKPPLRSIKHFEQARGQRVHLQTLEPVPMPPPAKPRRNWEGTLSEVDSATGKILISDNLGDHWIELAKVRSATWLREWSMPGRTDFQGSPSKTKKSKEKT